MSSSIKILHLEDNNIDAELIKETLEVYKLDCEITLTVSRDEFLNALIEDRFDIILADFNLPSFDGFEALKMAKKYAPNVPFIFISGVLGEELAIETLKRGATDYVIKSRLERLTPAIKRALKEQEEKVTRLKLERELAELEQMIGDLKSTYDELTKRVRGFLKIEIPELKYSIVDKFLADLSGYPISAWQRTPNFIATILHPDFEEYYTTKIDEFKKGFVPKMLEYKIIKPDGEERWWLQFNIGAFDAEGTLTSISAVIIDNTEDKENYLKYQNLFENALTGMYRTDVETGQIIEANTKMAEIFGFSSVEELKKVRATFFYPRPEKRDELIAKLKKSGFYESEILQLKRKDGSIIWVQESSRLYREQGFIEGIVIDITNQKLAEDAIKRDRSVFQLVANTAVFAKDVKSFCQEIIAGLTQIFQFDSGSIRLYDPETNLLHPIAVIGVVDPEVLENLPSVSLTKEGHTGALVGRTKKAIFAPDVKKHAVIKDFVPLLKGYTVRANITWPILNAKNELIGVLQLANQEPKDIQEEDKVLFETISSMVASALERLQAEQALRDSEEKFRAYAEQSLIGFMLVSDEGELLFYNDEISRISGFTREEISEMNTREITQLLFVEADLERLEKQVADIEANVTSSSIEEYQILTKDRQKKWISLHLAPINFHDATAMSVIVLEITEQKRARLTIERERQAFHIIATATINSEDVVDLSKRVLIGLLETLNFDKGIIRLFDPEKRLLYPAAFLFPDVPYDVKPISIDDPKYFNTYVAKTKQAVFAPDITKNEITIKFLERLNVFNVSTIVCWPILDKEQKLLGTILIASTPPAEISEEDRFFFNIISNFFSLALERKWSEAALRESQETFKKLIDTSPLAIFHTDLDCHIRLVNKYSLEMLGKTDEGELLGEDFSSLFIVQDRTRLLQDIEKVLETGSFANYDYLMVRPDKTIFPIELSASVILDNNEEPDSLLFIGNDVTVRKELERNLRRRYFEFEAMNKIISAGYRANDLNQFLDFVLNTILNSLDYSSGLIILQKGKNNLKICKSLGVSKQLMNAIQAGFSLETLLSPLFKSGKTIVIDDFHAFSQEFSLNGAKQLIGVPFFSKQKIIGAMILIVKEERIITDLDRQLLESIGKDIGIAIAKFQAEQTIKERQVDLLAIFDRLDEIIFIIDRQSGLILENNRVAKEKLGYTKRQLQKTSFLALLAKQHHKEYLDFLSKAKEGEAKSFLFAIKTKDQALKRMEATIHYQRYLKHEAVFAILKEV